ncbi:MAG: hypothetical protein ACOC56_05540 [Atribacterota bacterium]
MIEFENDIAVCEKSYFAVFSKILESVGDVIKRPQDIVLAHQQTKLLFELVSPVSYVNDCAKFLENVLYEGEGGRGKFDDIDVYSQSSEDLYRFVSENLPACRGG